MENNKKEQQTDQEFNKKLKWIAEFLEFELEGRTLDEQKALLLEFKNQSTILLEKL